MRHASVINVTPNGPCYDVNSVKRLKENEGLVLYMTQEGTPCF